MTSEPETNGSLPSAWMPLPGVTLRFLSDIEPGIRRIKRGESFVFLAPRGQRVTKTDRLRIRHLAIPPAWTDVWISPHADSHLQATGRDARGRKQYRYHDDWRLHRETTKFEKLPEFARALPALRKQVRSDLAGIGMTRERVLATVVQLLDKTLIRVGNDEYARENHSYGLTTLRNRHARVQGSHIHFSFRGKSGKQHEIDLNDPKLARIVRRCQELPGQELFEFVDGDGKPHPVGSADVNDYLRRLTGSDFTAKDFRTWHGTNLALNAHASGEYPPGSRNRVVAIAKHVASALGNTPAVCRRSYIHPAVIHACEKRLPIPPPPPRPTGLSADERRTLSFLESLQRPKVRHRRGTNPDRSKKEHA